MKIVAWDDFVLLQLILFHAKRRKKDSKAFPAGRLIAADRLPPIGSQKSFPRPEESIPTGTDAAG
jgi:hypothetical protein